MTIISQKYKFIFLAAPKTGTCAVEALLSGFNDLTLSTRHSKHAPYYEIARMMPDIADYFVFCYFRNPWDLMVSKYFFHRAAGYRDIKGIPICSNAKKMTFSEWVKVPEHRWLVYEYPIKNFKEFTRGLMQPDESVYRMPRIYAYEDGLEYGLLHLSEFTRLKGLHTKRTNVTKNKPKKHYSFFYGNDEEAIKAVMDDYYFSIAFFNYKFNRIGVPESASPL